MPCRTCRGCARVGAGVGAGGTSRALPPLPSDTRGSLRPCWHGWSFLPGLSPPPFFRDRFGARSCSLEPAACSQPSGAAVSKNGVGGLEGSDASASMRASPHIASVTCNISSVFLCRKQLCSLPAQHRNGGNQVGKSGGRSSPPACVSSGGISGRHRGGWGWEGLGGCEPWC